MNQNLDLRTLTMPVRDSGMVLGVDSRRRTTIVLRVFGPRGQRIAVVGGPWFGKLIVFRALAIGAHAIVRTRDIPTWEGFGEKACGRPDRIRVVKPASGQPLMHPTPVQPGLLVDDLGAVAGTCQPAAWQTQLSLLRSVTAASAPVLAGADVAIVQQLAPAEAEIVADALHLRPKDVNRLQGLFPYMAAVIGGGIDRWIDLTPTEIERGLLGAPSR